MIDAIFIAVGIIYTSCAGGIAVVTGIRRTGIDGIILVVAVDFIGHGAFGVMAFDAVSIAVFIDTVRAIAAGGHADLVFCVLFVDDLTAFTVAAIGIFCAVDSAEVPVAEFHTEVFASRAAGAGKIVFGSFTGLACGIGAWVADGDEIASIGGHGQAFHVMFSAFAVLVIAFAAASAGAHFAAVGRNTGQIFATVFVFLTRVGVAIASGRIIFRGFGAWWRFVVFDADAVLTDQRCIAVLGARARITAYALLAAFASDRVPAP